jgi:RNA polymerase sigma factor (sigma-70 family)
LAKRLHVSEAPGVHPIDMDEPLRLAAEAPASETLEATHSFETFYDAESHTLFRRLWLITGNRAEAEEIMQDAFLKVWERWDRVGTMDDPTGYLYRTAMNLFRKRYRRAVLAVRRSIGLSSPRDDFAEADERQTVRRVLATLPPRQRAALVLTEMLGFSADDAGRALGVRPATVRSLSHQGRASFRRAMEVDDG